MIPTDFIFLFIIWVVFFFYDPSWSESNFILFLLFYSIRVDPTRTGGRSWSGATFVPASLIYLYLDLPDVGCRVFWYFCTWVYSRFRQVSLGSTGSFLVKGVSAKNDANWAWLDSLAHILILVIFGIPLFKPTEEPGPRVFAREKEVTWSVRPGMPLLEFSGWLYSVFLYDLNTGIWGHPSDQFLTSSDPLSVGIWFHHSKRKITYALLLLLIHIWKNLRLLPLGIGRYTRILSND